MKMRMCFLSRVWLLLMTCFCGMSAMAANYTELQLEETFVLTDWGKEVWTYTATQDGIVKVVGADPDEYFGPCLAVYSDEKFTKQIDNFLYGPAHYEFAVTTGNVYYIKNNNSCGQDIKAKLTMGAGVFAFEYAEPGEGGLLSITSNETVYLRFSTSNVDFEQGEVTVNGEVIKVFNYKNWNDLVVAGEVETTQVGTSGVENWKGSIFGRTANEDGIAISFTTHTGKGFYNVLNKLNEDGKLNAGDPIKLNVHGVKSNFTDELLNGDGELEVTWYFAGAPTTLVSYNVPNVIKSWYNEGDPEAVASFTFSRNISSAYAMLEMGQGEGADDLYVEEIAKNKISVDENTVYVDLSGVTRTYKSMGLNNAWQSFTLTLYGVIDENGDETYSEGLGSAASYSFTASYKDVSGTMASEFVPAAGTTLTSDIKEIEIWFDRSDLITWDGVIVKNSDINIFLPKADLDVTVDGNETTIIVPVPEEAYEARNVTVKVNVTSTTDGGNHVISANYNTQSVAIAEISATAEPAAVYSISGTQVMKSATAADINALPAGLYIINGKKVIR